MFCIYIVSIKIDYLLRLNIFYFFFFLQFFLFFFIFFIFLIFFFLVSFFLSLFLVGFHIGFDVGLLVGKLISANVGNIIVEGDIDPQFIDNINGKSIDDIVITIRPDIEGKVLDKVTRTLVYGIGTARFILTIFTKELISIVYNTNPQNQASLLLLIYYNLIYYSKI